MKVGTGTVRARSVPVSLDAESADLEDYDYADAFAMKLPDPDARTAEQWVRSGLEEAPGPVRGLIRLVHRRVLGFDLGPAGSPGHVIGWRILRNRPEALRIETESELVRGVIVALRPSPHEVTLQTFLFYRRPARARRVWALVGPLHRSIAPLLLSRAAGTGHRSRRGGTSG